MKTSPNKFCSRAFTLIELLVVIAIIAILAAMLFPAIGVAKRKAAEASARADMQNIALAIGRYEADYNGRFPAPGIPTGSSDVTYGYVTNNAPPNIIVSNQNAQVIAILMDVEKFNNGNVTSNANHVLNPRRVANLNAKFAPDNTSQGVGNDGEYRDPWGNSYVISMDTSLDDKVRDHLYSRSAVSFDNSPPAASAPAQKGFYGLSNPSGAANQFEYNGKFLIWSRGADGKANPNQRAKDGDNKDNLLHWQ